MFPLNPAVADAARLWSQMTSIALDSQTTISLRWGGLLGLLPQSGDESYRMVSEKIDAATESGWAMLSAAGRFAPATEIMSDGLRPYGSRTEDNARRLSSSLRRPR
ncbi:MAG: antibiotic ABC transporter [Paracoccus sp. (in: a-proteobacteria)]|nr:antibiotic ABC transporter [Paracoccus sp. (in: a-proteobacteria)]